MSQFSVFVFSNPKVFADPRSDGLGASEWSWTLQVGFGDQKDDRNRKARHILTGNPRFWLRGGYDTCQYGCYSLRFFGKSLRV